MQKKEIYYGTWKIRKPGKWQRFCAFATGTAKRRILLILCSVLLVASVTKIISDAFFYQKKELVDAFAAGDANVVESVLQVTADYGTAFLTERDKQGLIAYLAGAIGVQMDGTTQQTETEDAQVYTYVKKAKQAATTIKAVTLREDVAHTYLAVEIDIYQDSEYYALKYRDIILKAMEELKVNQVETTLQLSGRYTGKLAFSEWNRLADRMVKQLNSKIVYQNRDEELYTIYAYSNQLSEYITVEGKKINVQVAVSYDKNADQTVVYLATPIIRGEW